MDSLAYVVKKYGLDPDVRRMPIEIPDMGRNDLAGLFAELDFRTGVEVGVECGLYTEVLCQANPEATIYAVDPWQTYDNYREYVSQGKLDRFYEITKWRLSPYRCQIMRKFSMQAAKDFEPDSLDFVYLDGNHSLPFVVQDIAAWSDRVRPGGIVSGHDYRKTKAPLTMLHVVQAVNAWTDAYRIRPWFVCGTREKKAGETRDTSRSWFWVKQ